MCPPATPGLDCAGPGPQCHNDRMRETHLRMERQTVKLGLAKVVHDLFPDDSLKTSYSILEGVFCNLAGSVMSPKYTSRR